MVGYRDRVIDVTGDFQPQFVNMVDVPLLNVVEGIGLKPVFGEKILLSFVYMEPNRVAPVHSHPEEQIGTIRDMMDEALRKKEEF